MFCLSMSRYNCLLSRSKLNFSVSSTEPRREDNGLLNAFLLAYTISTISAISSILSFSSSFIFSSIARVLSPCGILNLLFNTWSFNSFD